MTHEAELNRVADLYGGLDCSRSLSDDGCSITFVTEDHMRYRAWAPGRSSYAELAEDDGRPFFHRVPAGMIIGRCLTDAPDSVFSVALADLEVAS
jgi:hypothetical protein